MHSLANGQSNGATYVIYSGPGVVNVYCKLAEVFLASMRVLSLKILLLYSNYYYSMFVFTGQSLFL